MTFDKWQSITPEQHQNDEGAKGSCKSIPIALAEFPPIKTESRPRGNIKNKRLEIIMGH